MLEEEKDLLLEIERLYNKLSNESNGDNYHEQAVELRDKINQLLTDYSPDYLDNIHYNRLVHTIDKEVFIVKNSYQELNESRVSKVEFSTTLNKANLQIKVDMHPVFYKIKEVKDNN